MVDETPKYAAPLDFDWRQRDHLITEIFTDNKKVLVNVFNPGEKDKFLIKIKVPTYKYKGKETFLYNTLLIIFS